MHLIMISAGIFFIWLMGISPLFVQDLPNPAGCSDRDPDNC
jgi:hypothetical protein